uniref:SET domain-containing protein n=1 Tax=Macrostomum lignano TaxID=282301 RepID=A0A1I8FS65_9PLAT
MSRSSSTSSSGSEENQSETETPLAAALQASIQDQADQAEPEAVVEKAKAAECAWAHMPIMQQAQRQRQQQQANVQVQAKSKRPLSLSHAASSSAQTEEPPTKKPRGTVCDPHYCVDCLQRGLPLSNCRIYRNNGSSRKTHRSRWHKEDPANKILTYCRPDHADVRDLIAARPANENEKQVKKRITKAMVSHEVLEVESASDEESPERPEVPMTTEPEAEQQQSEGPKTNLVVNIEVLESSAVDQRSSSFVRQLADASPILPSPAEAASTASSSTSGRDLLAIVTGLEIKMAEAARQLALLPIILNVVRDLALSQATSSSNSRGQNLPKVPPIVASNMAELLENEMLATAPCGEDTILYCVPCYNVLMEGTAFSPKLTVAERHSTLNPKSMGTLARGQLITKLEMTEILACGEAFSRLRYRIVKHLSGIEAVGHVKAMKKYADRKIEEKRVSGTVRRLLRCSVANIESASASKHYETFVSMLYRSDAEVGQRGHGRYVPYYVVCICMPLAKLWLFCTLFVNLPPTMHPTREFNKELWSLFEVTADKYTAEFLQTPLPSTGCPPCYAIACDKSTPGRITNQAVMVLARCETGDAVAIPGGAPAVYSKEMDGSGPVLVQRLFQGLANFDLPIDRLVGVIADGQYQTAPFKTAIFEKLKEAGADYEIPINWDPAHFINLAVTNVRDSDDGEALQDFIDRANLFPHLFGHGRGRSALEIASEDHAGAISSFASQRFTSSAMNQWQTIFRCYGDLHAAFRAEKPRVRDNDPQPYIMFGFDFVCDLLGYLDLFAPIKALMEIAQNLQLPHWKVSTLWPLVAEFLHVHAEQFRSEDYPTLHEHIDNLHVGGTFDGVTLLDGWLKVKKPVAGSASDQDQWRARDMEDIARDTQKLAGALHRSFVARIQRCCDPSTSDCASFDAAAIIRAIACRDPEVAAEEFADQCAPAFKRLVTEAVKHKHLAHLKVPMARRYAANFVDTIRHVIFTGEGRSSWLVPSINGPLTDLKVAAPTLARQLLLHLSGSTAGGEFSSVVVDEAAVYASFYADPDVFQRAGPATCALLDFALHRGGTEAIVESFYSTMRSQQQQGGQTNDTLQLRAKLAWLLPPMGGDACEEFLDDSAKLFFKGDKSRGIRPHWSPFFAAKTKDAIGKVLQRRAAAVSRVPFIGRRKQKPKDGDNNAN